MVNDYALDSRATKPQPPPMTAKTTRDRLLEEATTLFWRNGYQAVSVETICDAAAANRGSFYYAFPSKEELLGAVITRIWDHDRTEIEQIYAVPGSARAKLIRHMRWFGDTQRGFLSREGRVPGHLHMAVDVNVPETARVIIRRSRSQHLAILRAAIEAVLAEAAASAEAADWLLPVISHLISGTMMEARLSNTLDPLDTLPGMVARLLDETVSAPRR